MQGLMRFPVSAEITLVCEGVSQVVSVSLSGHIMFCSKFSISSELLLGPRRMPIAISFGMIMQPPVICY